MPPERRNLSSKMEASDILYLAPEESPPLGDIGSAPGLSPGLVHGHHHVHRAFSLCACLPTSKRPLFISTPVTLN